MQTLHYRYLDRHRYYGNKIKKQKQVQLFATPPQRKPYRKVLYSFNAFQNKLYTDKNYKHLIDDLREIFYNQN